MGLDLDDPVIRARSWRWFHTRLEGLTTRPVGLDPSGLPLFANRVQEVVLADLYRPTERSAS